MIEYLGSMQEVLSGQRHDVCEVLDVSLREQGTTTVYGQTTKSMLEDFKQIIDFGCKRHQIASFNFQDSYTVQDQFVLRLKDEIESFEGCFAAFPLEDSHFALPKIEQYQIPNILLDTFFADEDGYFSPQKASSQAKRLIQTLENLREILPKRYINPITQKPIGEIYINFGDYFEQRHHHTFFEEVFEAVKKIGIQGICFEEFRGIGRLEDVYETTTRLRSYFPDEDYTLLAHIHGGNGLEDAATLISAVGGANGVWTALTPLSSLCSHGSSLVYLTNLMRYGNKQVDERYNIEEAYHIASSMYSRSFAHQEKLPKERPIIGENAYTLNVRSLHQENSDHQGMIPSHQIGRSLDYRIVPLLNDSYCIQKRFEAIGYRISEQEALSFKTYMHTYLLDDIHHCIDTRIDFNSESFLHTYANTHFPKSLFKKARVKHTKPPKENYKDVS